MTVISSDMLIAHMQGSACERFALLQNLKGGGRPRSLVMTTVCGIN